MGNELQGCCTDREKTIGNIKKLHAKGRQRAGLTPEPKQKALWDLKTSEEI